MVIFCCYALDEAHVAIGVEGVLERAQVIEHNAEAPNVDLEGPSLTLDDLRGKVVRGAKQILNYRLCRVKDLGDAKICQLDLSILCQ